MASKNKTEVLIGGRIYTVSGYESEEYLQKVATYLNNKISEVKTLDGYHRLSSDMQSLLLNLNIADDYFKIKKQAEDLERVLSEKDKELYDMKQELVSIQIKLAAADKAAASLQSAVNEYEKKVVGLETQLDHNRNRKNQKA